MESIVLVLAVIGIFALILYAVERFDHFMKDNYKGPRIR